MDDVLMIAVVGAFFGMATLYVRLCDRVIGADPLDAPELDPNAGTEVDRDPRVRR